LPRAREPGHDRALRDPDDLGDLGVREPLHVAQDDDLAEFERQAADRRVQRVVQRTAQQVGLWVVHGKRIGLDRVHGLGPPPLLSPAREPGEGGPADDGEQPGAHVAAAEGLEVTEGTQVGFLDDVVGVGPVAQQVARQGVRRVEVRQSVSFESRQLVSVHGRPDGCQLSP
jgi:hypothetical protein